jgi:uncharacterized repeat protein (TIGR01451 family)
MTLSTIAAGLAVVLAFSGAAAYGSGFTALPGHVPEIVTHLSAKGLLPADTNLTLAIGLPLRNEASLSSLLQQVYDPSNPNFHKFITPDEFTAQFGPTEQQYQAVKDFAAANGLKVTGTHPNRMLLDVSGKASDIQNAFHVTLKTYQHPKENRDFYAPDTEPSVDSSLPIIRVDGLENYYIPHSNAKASPLLQSGNATPLLGSGPAGTYQGSDFRKAYVPGTRLTGAGQNVALVQFDAFYASDIAAYESLIGLTTNVPQLVVVPVDGGVSTPGGGNPEVSLDLEMVISMAPGVSNIYVYEAPNPSPWVDMLNKIANDNLAKQISSSWGGGLPDPVSEQIFKQMAVQGQTYFNAVGDSDAFNSTNNPIVFEFPSESPNITQVGGTFLTTGTSKNYSSETVWNRDVQIGPQWDGVGGSGGISTTFTIPSWQTNINMTLSQGSTNMRNVPDVALTAENVNVLFGGGSQGAYGGTSCAAPLWAGFMALVNQQAASNGQSSIGFLNPAVYGIAKGTNYGNCFHDVTTGNNEWSGSPTLFSAVSGYDLCTGLGSPNGTNLINALSPPGTSGISNVVTHISAPLPPYGSTLSALNGNNPNGTWELFVQDDTPLNVGIISNGYWLTLTTANPVGFAADIELLSAGLPSTNVLTGSNVVCLLTATNYGPSGATNIIISDELPLGATFVSGTASAGAVIRSGSTIIWTMGSLGINTGASLAVTLNFSASGSYLNSAQVTSDTSDPNPDDGSPSLTFVVGSTPPPAVSASYINSSGAFLLNVTGSVPSVIVQASTNLTSWTDIYTGAPPFVYTNYDVTNYPMRFYRALVGP